MMQHAAIKRVRDGPRAAARYGRAAACAHDRTRPISVGGCELHGRGVTCKHALHRQTRSLRRASDAALRPGIQRALHARARHVASATALCAQSYSARSTAGSSGPSAGGIAYFLRSAALTHASAWPSLAAGVPCQRVTSARGVRARVRWVVIGAGADDTRHQHGPHGRAAAGNNTPPTPSAHPNTPNTQHQSAHARHGCISG